MFLSLFVVSLLPAHTHTHTQKEDRRVRTVTAKKTTMSIRLGEHQCVSIVLNLWDCETNAREIWEHPSHDKSEKKANFDQHIHAIFKTKPKTFANDLYMWMQPIPSCRVEISDCKFHWNIEFPICIPVDEKEGAPKQGQNVWNSSFWPILNRMTSPTKKMRHHPVCVCVQSCLKKW